MLRASSFDGQGDAGADDRAGSAARCLWLLAGHLCTALGGRQAGRACGPAATCPAGVDAAALAARDGMPHGYCCLLVSH